MTAEYPERESASSYVCARLKAHGVQRYFTVAGDFIMPFLGGSNVLKRALSWSVPNPPTLPYLSLTPYLTSL